jgi:glycerol uptake facilitator protein
VETAIKDTNIYKKMLGEFVACFVLGFVGLGTIYQAIVYGAGTVPEIGIMFGICIMFAVIIAGPISGALLNPAITIAFAVFNKFPKKDVIPFCVAQVLGWFVGCLLLVAVTNDSILLWEASIQVARGTPSDVYSAQVFLCNMPNMLMANGLGAGLGSGVASWPTWASILNEIGATMTLTLSVLVFTDPKNRFRPQVKSFALWLGLIIALAISMFLAGSTACMNPARDLGPRMALYLFGWGQSTFPGLGFGSGGVWWVWWVVPIAGAILATALYEFGLNKWVLDNELLVK